MKKTNQPDQQNSAASPVLVTGASSGIGREIAREFSRRGHLVIIVAPVAGELEAVAREIQAETRGEVHSLAQDLRSPQAALEISGRLDEIGLTPGILVNNAGLGYRGSFWEVPLENDIEMVELNILAVLRLTKQILPGLMARGGGRILNTASVAGFEPGPMMAVYHATKAFVLSWSEALATELKDHDITVTALCPGPVDTDFFVKGDMIASRAFQEGNLMGPNEVAVAGVEATLRGERVVVPGGINKTMVFSRRLTGESVQAGMNAALYQNAPPEKQKRKRGDIEDAEAEANQGKSR